MLPALLKAQQLQASQDTAESIARVVERLDSIEAANVSLQTKLDEVLGLTRELAKPLPPAQTTNGRRGN